MKKLIIAFSSTFLIPAVALAQVFNPTYVEDALRVGKGWLGTAITIVMILMTLFFLWAIFNFIREKDPTKMKDRKKQVVNGLIGLFIAVAVWGIIRIALGIFGLNQTTTSSPVLTCPPGFIARNGICQPR